MENKHDENYENNSENLDNNLTVLDYIKKIEDDNVVIYNRSVTYFKNMVFAKVILFFSFLIPIVAQFLKFKNKYGETVGSPIFIYFISIGLFVLSVYYAIQAYKTKTYLQKI